MKLLLLIPSLAAGGAEGQLVLLANGFGRLGHDVTVAVLSGGGRLEQKLSGVRLADLGKGCKRDLPRTLSRLATLVRREKPDILHSYLGTANILAALCGMLFPGLRVVFGLRASNVALDDLGFTSRLAYRLERLLSRRANLVIANSEAGRMHAVACGFPAARMAVVPNAVDPQRYSPAPRDAALLRDELGIKPEEQLVGVVARLDPMKDQLGFVEAAARVLLTRPAVRFLLVGAGLESYALRVRERIASLDLGGRILLAGTRADMPAAYSALDVLCLPSAYGEGFPNAVAEALACGTPCVVTDVGDAATLAHRAGAAGLVVPPRDSEALAHGLLVMLDRVKDSGPDLSDQARAAISVYSPEVLAQRTEALLKALIR